MSTFNLIPNPGILTARIFENDYIGLKPTMFFDIEIPIEPFLLNGEKQITAVRLNFINFQTTNWRDLENHSFTFPINPHEGYIDGTIYLGNIHNPVDVTRMSFGEFHHAAELSTIIVTINVEIDFTYQGLDLGIWKLQWEVMLDCHPSSFDAVAQELQRKLFDFPPKRQYPKLP